MNLPLVISATKIHMVPMKNTRRNYRQEAYLNEPHFIVSTENPQTSRAHLYNTRGRKTSKKKCKNKRKSNHQKNSSIKLSDCEAALKLYSVAKGKYTRQAERNVLNTARNQDISNTPSLLCCTAGKIVSTYSSKRSPAKSCSTRSNASTSQRRPPTSSSKATRPTKTAEIENKRQSCPPLHQSQSPIRKEVKIRKVYYSEAQSQMLAGIPCAPPATPLNDVLIAVEIVPCMADIKSQQAIKTKLRNLEIQRRKANEKMRENFLKEEKRRVKEKIESIKQQQRAEIYALNKVMTDLEREKFLQFMKERNNGTTTISLKV